MKIGLMADLRGEIGLLRIALEVLAGEGCDRIACLGSTAEGGDDDDEVLEALRGVDALIIPSPHDSPAEVTEKPSDVELGGLTLAHATPSGCPHDDVLWSTGFAAPSLLLAAEYLGGEGAGQRACADLYEPIIYEKTGAGSTRRLFLFTGSHVVGDGPFLLCPGSVAVAPACARGGAVSTWDEASREVRALRFSASGSLAPRRPRVLVGCPNFEPHVPPDDALVGIELEVVTRADSVADRVRDWVPDLLLLDYDFQCEETGLDILIGLCAGGQPPVPCLTIAENPADSQAMKASGAVGGLPHVFLRDTLTRLLREIA